MSVSGATTLTEMFKHTVVKSKYIVLDDNDNVEYVIKVKSTKKGNKRYRLYHSDNKIWTDKARGKLILTLVEKGDDFYYNFEALSGISVLNAAELGYLRLILNFEYGNYKGNTDSNIIKEY